MHPNGTSSNYKHFPRLLLRRRCGPTWPYRQPARLGASRGPGPTAWVIRKEIAAPTCGRLVVPGADASQVRPLGCSARALHDVVPTQGGRADRGVAEARGDGREVRALGGGSRGGDTGCEARCPWVEPASCRSATPWNTKFSFSGAPFELTTIRSRSAR